LRCVAFRRLHLAKAGCNGILITTDCDDKVEECDTDHIACSDD
jgi:hypothetical protein